MSSSSSLFPPITPFSFSSGPGNALRKAKAVQNCGACRRRKTKCDRLWPCTPCKDRGEANLCEQYVKEPNDRPTGYTHVLDTSILANRVAQLEAVLSRLLIRVDQPDAYNDLLNNFSDPLPAFKPKDHEDRNKAKEEHDDDDEQHRNKKRRESTASSHRPGTAPSSGSAVQPPPSHQGPTTPSQMIMTPFRSDALDTTPGTVSFATQNQIMPALEMPYLANHAAATSSWLGLQQQRDPTSSSFHNPYNNDANTNNNNNNSSSRRNHSYEPASKAPSAHEHDAALALEGMALGREVHGVHQSNRSSGDEEEGNEPTPGSPLTFASFIHNKRSFKQSGQLQSFPTVNQLPPLVFGKYIINHYLENVDFRWRCLHRPTFQRQYDELSNRLRLHSTDFYREELSTLALYASCLAVGIHFLDEDGYRDLNLNEEQAENLAATCWKVSYEALEASDWMQVHDIRSCQTIIIAGIYLSSARRANQHWTLLGSATKVAMALGLASVPDEAKMNDSQARVPRRWRSAIDREVGRRVWYCLLELDQLFAIEYGFLYLISPEISQTGEPANVNDVDIQENQPVVSRPGDQYTDMSYFLQRLKLFYPFQGVVQKARKAGRMRYSFVIEANEELQNAIANPPAFYKQANLGDHAMDAGEMFKIKRESIALSEGSDLRLMRLHRYYFSEACNNPRYLLSKQTCLTCARHILQATAPRDVNIHYYGHTYSKFAATMVMIIYMSYALPQEIEEVKSQVARGIEHLRALSRKRRTELGETADILQSLMNVQLEKRVDEPPSDAQKREFSEMDADAWEGWLPPDLLALARANVGFMGDLGAVTNDGNNTMSTDPQQPDTSMMFESILDDLHFNQSNYIIM